MDEERTAANRRHWEELAALHPDTEFYDVDAVLAGGSSLREIEREELPDLAGLDVLHLQCHIGLDSISLAREGATVTAIDYAAEAIEAARELADGAGVDVEFVECDVRDAPDALDRTFDLVFASYGVLVWIPDVGEWAAVAAEMLAPGGACYLVDYHPFTDTFGPDLRPADDYFGDEPVAVEDTGSYADVDPDFEGGRTYEWRHSMGSIVTALVDAGLSIEFLHEFPHAYFQRFEAMHRDDAGRWWLDEEPQLPQLFSVLATN